MESDFTKSRCRMTSIVLALLLASPALGHRLDVMPVYDGESLQVVVMDGFGQPVMGASIRLDDTEGHLLREDRTDAEGRCSFLLRPVPARLRILAQTADGHLSIQRMHRDDRGGLVTEAAKTQEATTPHRENGQTEPEATGDPAQLARRVAALEAEVARLQSRRQAVRAQDVVAGLAFLFAAAALLWMWLQRRESKCRAAERVS